MEEKTECLTPSFKGQKLGIMNSGEDLGKRGKHRMSKRLVDSLVLLAAQPVSMDV